MYKVKGAGDTREVWDGDWLVGRLHRSESHEASITMTPTRATLRKTKVVSWRATHPDGSPVMRWDRPDRREVQDTIKAWRRPMLWCGGSSRQQPRAADNTTP